MPQRCRLTCEQRKDARGQAVGVAGGIAAIGEHDVGNAVAVYVARVGKVGSALHGSGEQLHRG